MFWEVAGLLVVCLACGSFGGGYLLADVVFGQFFLDVWGRSFLLFARVAVTAICRVACAVFWALPSGQRFFFLVWACCAQFARRKVAVRRMVLARGMAKERALGLAKAAALAPPPLAFTERPFCALAETVRGDFTKQVQSSRPRAGLPFLVR